MAQVLPPLIAFYSQHTLREPQNGSCEFDSRNSTFKDLLKGGGGVPNLDSSSCFVFCVLVEAFWNIPICSGIVPICHDFPDLSFSSVSAK